MNRPIQPQGVAQPVAQFALAVETNLPSKMLHTSGIVPERLAGGVASTLAGQAETVWSIVGAILAEAEMDVTDIVSVVTYVVAGEDLAVAMAARDSFFGDHRAASTLVTVPALATPEWKLEVSVVAAQ